MQCRTKILIYCYKYKKSFWIWSAFKHLRRSTLSSYQQYLFHHGTSVHEGQFPVSRFYLIGRILEGTYLPQSDRGKVSSWTCSSFNSLTNKRRRYRNQAETLSSFLTSAKVSFRHFWNKYPLRFRLLCEVESKSKYLESHMLHRVAMSSW